MEVTSVPPLIADSDLAFLRALSVDPRAKTLPPMLASTQELAEQAILDVSKPVSAVFIASSIANPMGLPLVRAVLQHRPNTPIFFVGEDALPKHVDAESMRKLSVSRTGVCSRQKWLFPRTLGRLLYA